MWRYKCQGLLKLLQADKLVLVGNYYLVTIYKSHPLSQVEQQHSIYTIPDQLQAEAEKLLLVGVAATRVDRT